MLAASGDVPLPTAVDEESANGAASEARALLPHGVEIASVGKAARPVSSVARASRLVAALRHHAQTEPLLFYTLAGVIVGVVVGSVVHSIAGGPLSASPRELLGLPGSLFMSALKGCVIPLIAGSAFSGVLSLCTTVAASDAKKLAKRTLLLYLASMLCAVTVGIACMTLFRPGEGVVLSAGGCGAAPASATATASTISGLDALVNVFKSLVPPNLFAALANGNVLGIIFVAIASALAVVATGGARSALAGVTAFNAVISKLVGWILLCTPLCIASLIAAQIAATCRPLELLSSLSQFVAVYLLGLLIHAGIVIPLALRFVAGASPRAVFKGAAPALTTVFATDSSSATLPVTLACCKERLKLPPVVVDFVIPLGTTVNMDGTALYEAVAVLFIAQVHGVPLGVSGTIIVALTATLAAVGAPAIPSAGLVTMLMVLQATGLIQYADDIGVLLACDWLLDRCRSVVNVIGDVACCVIVDALTERERKRADAEPGGRSAAREGVALETMAAHAENGDAAGRAAPELAHAPGHDGALDAATHAL